MDGMVEMGKGGWGLREPDSAPIPKFGYKIYCYLYSCL